MRFAFILALALAAVGGCHNDKQEVLEPGGPPPLPPASGTAVGYLIDAAGDLKLRDDQLTKLHAIDDSLAARNGQIDAQLRQIEKPVPGEELTPQQQKAGEKAPRYNNAPGASTITTEDSQKLRKIRDDNDSDALKQALATLDTDQQVRAKRILQDRGIALPGQKAQESSSSADGTPLPGMEP
ncbi:MAG: hypothetical protein HOV81_34565 [Kofleriaceae bacterium]|nr:hypothetical protein [Kofleriaceae bacterium]